LKCFCAFPLLLLIVCGATLAPAQSTDATISGVVVDPSGKIIQDAGIEILNEATGVRYSSKTNDAGIYTVTILPPGEYRVQVTKVGFKTLIKPGIVLNVQSAVALNFTLPIGAASESVTVNAGVSQINTTNASVSTVIDSKFVENIPLNGRSFQDLILLTPGIVTNTPQLASGLGQTGEFSVNGQRTESNSYIVDGVSANVGASFQVNGAGPSGSLPASTALGTTQALVSVDALQEFRVESSTYSAEYGRNPGGQFSMVTRSGTNDWHGTAFNYFRNDALDANSWFNDDTVPITPKSAERQNDFGGTFGGPAFIPHIYSGKSRTFFFFSYEGLRLVQPNDVTINAVPDLALRQSAPAPLNQVLNAFPLPTPNTPDLGDGLTEYVAAWSTPSSIDAVSVRLDQAMRNNSRIFFRYSQTPSSSATRGNSLIGSGGQGTSPSVVNDNSYKLRTFTLGVTNVLTAQTSNEFRANLTTNALEAVSYLNNIGGAQPVNLASLQGFNQSSTFNVNPSFYLGAYAIGLDAALSSGSQRQWNVVDTFSASRGKHNLKAGIDWRRLTPIINPGPYAYYEYDSEASVSANSVDYGTGISSATFYPDYLNFSVFLQDEWRVTSRLNLSLGIRWEVNPAPGSTSGLTPYTVTGLSDLSTLQLAPAGTPLWKTSWYNLAPRLGAAYVVNPEPRYETVIRAGGGVFFDTGQQLGSYGFEGPGFSAFSYFGTDNGVPASFPVAASVVNPPIVNPPSPPYGVLFANPPHMQLPYSFQWNTSLEQALGMAQSLTVSYVGANGRRLLEDADISASHVNPDLGASLYLVTNGLTSSYNALQIKFERQVLHGLQSLASYTWSHSLDFGSFNAALPYQRGNSSQDVRNNLSAGISYELSSTGKSLLPRTLLQNWGVDGRLTARSGYPVTLNGRSVTDPATGEVYWGGLNREPGVPIYIAGPQYPGRRSIDPAAFALPAVGQSGNAPRNFVRGFGATQLDFAMRRQFPIFEKLQGQFRAEVFNILNHPNFGTINPYYGNIQFGQATASLAQSLGTLSPLYQMGGSRSCQLALRFSF
jgi:hypothetical protein